MKNQPSLQETKQHGAVRFPFNLYPCTIPEDFSQVALHWHDSMELVFVKRGAGQVQVGAVTYPARMGGNLCFYARNAPRSAADRGAVHGIRELHL